MTQPTLNIQLPSYAASALQSLEDAGYEAWCVGGCVRDALLGRPVHDYDIATSADWRETERVLGASGFAVHRTVTQHGTVTASLDGHAIEVTTYRADGVYSDGRHPDQVVFVRSIRDDLARRDFTMNALAYHPERGMLDCWGGVDDLKRGVIRAIGDPVERFREDSLRILRACRFASQLGFSLAPDTLQAMKSCKMGLLRVSAERITHELDELLLGAYVHDALMLTVDVLVAVLPEIAACRGFEQHTPYHIYDVWEHTAWVVQYSPATRLARWAALFHDIGKPAAFFMDGDRGHFFGHPKISVVLARDAMARLLFSPAFSAKVLYLVGAHDRQIAANAASVRRALAHIDGDVDLFRALIELKRADCRAHSELGAARLALVEDVSRVLDEVLSSQSAFTVKQLAITGNDVMALGVAQGPAVGAMLRACLDEVIDGRLPNEKSPLLSFVSAQIS